MPRFVCSRQRRPAPESVRLPGAGSAGSNGLVEMLRASGRTVHPRGVAREIAAVRRDDDFHDDVVASVTGIERTPPFTETGLEEE